MFEHTQRRQVIRRTILAAWRLLRRIVPAQRLEAASAEQRFMRRALVLAGAQGVLLGVLGLRLHDLQVTYSRRYKRLAEENRIDILQLPARRGDIRDRSGQILAESVENLQATIIPDLAGNVDAALQRLAKIVTVDAADRARVIEIASKQSRLIPILVRGNLTWEEFARISLMAPELPGIEASIGWTRQYRRSAEVGHIVGYVGKGDKLDVERDPSLRLPGQRIGKVGIERGLDATLKGLPGSVKREVDARGRIIRDLERVPPVPGKTIDLALDSEFQAWLLNRLQSEDWSAAVVMDVRNGEVVALGSTPAFDPAAFSDGITAAALQQLFRTPGAPMFNKATRGLYPPGSTYKIVTALAGLDAGIITADTIVSCSGAIDYGGNRFRCWKGSGHGRVKLQRALVESCDCYFYEVARQLGVDRLAEAARILGFGAVHDLGIAPEKGGVVPDPGWKVQNTLRPWLGGETLLAGIGQGYVLATPLHLALMTARVASGRMLKPVMVRDGTDGQDAPPLPFAAEHLALVRAGLEGVVNDANGTGKRAASSQYRVAGKTGTAQVARISTEKNHGDLPREKRDHALFVGYIPSEHPRYAVSAIVEHGGSGGTTAAPLARDILVAAMDSDVARTTPPPTATPESPRPAGPSPKDWG